MSPEELKQTTLDPANRTLHRITLDDALKAQETLEMCMGTDVILRRTFIEDNAYRITDLII